MRATPAIVTLCSALFACGGSSGDATSDGGGASNGSDGGGASNGSNGGGGPSGSNGGGASNGSDGGGASNGSDGGTGTTTRRNVGAVTLTSTRYAVGSTPVEYGVASAYFLVLPAPSPGAPSQCSVQTDGACTVTRCALSSGDSGAASYTYVSAGTIDVTGVLVSGGDLTIAPAGNAPYSTVNGSLAYWNGGESIRVRAPGDAQGAPSFDATLLAPTPLRLTAPSFDAQAHVAASASAPLHVAWSGSTAGDVVAILAMSGGGLSVSARCVFPAGSASGDVPASVVAQMAGGTASFGLSSSSRKEIDLGDWAITVSLDSYAARDAGLASGILDVR